MVKASYVLSQCLFIPGHEVTTDTRGDSHVTLMRATADRI